ncbi:hypothetical protein M2C68_21150, partial [Pseudomonas sp. BAgro211]|nr:hypothetical protein [Pseudomonas sp. BAgro211]
AANAASRHPGPAPRRRLDEKQQPGSALLQTQQGITSATGKPLKDKAFPDWHSACLVTAMSLSLPSD